MTHKLMEDGAWYKNAAGLYVQMEPIDRTLVASASDYDLIGRASDGTLVPITLVAGTGVTLVTDGTTITINATGGGAAGIADPTEITGLTLWLAADESSLSAGAITTWPDQSGNSRDATGVGSIKPTRVDNVVSTLPVMRFDGANAYFTLPDYMTSLTASTWFMALKIDADPPASGTATGLFRLSSSSDNTHYPFTDSNVYLSYGSANRYSANPATSLATWHRLIVTVDATGWVMYVNNSPVISQGPQTLGWTTAPTIGKSIGSFFLDGDVLECGQYDSVLSDDDRGLLDDYLAARINGTWTPP